MADDSPAPRDPSIEATRSNRVFISYRRDDAPGSVGRLHDLLARRFGSSQVFMDVDTIRAGANWRDVIRQAIEDAGVLIVIIGPRWSEAGDDGRPRLFDSEDMVRTELQMAREVGLGIIPVLVAEASIPTASQVPGELQWLLEHNAHELRHDRFQADAGHLLEALEALGVGPEEERGPPERLGPYRILRLLGEGGMGEVYEAKQTEPVKRRVAVKIIKLGMDTKQIVARFEAERQALAVMDHPHIAKVFEAGATRTGRPFFVMELVKGTPLSEYCDDQQLSIEDRLRLYIPICQAVQHAHQKGVIHRDLKPCNVLVSVQDGVATPKVIDFGIAKAMGQSLTEKTLVTHFGQIMGTPEYMSPEQLSGLDVDTRTDVYALGVMLYELLVGTLPIDLSEVPASELPATVRDTDPQRPSARFQTRDDRERVATARDTDPGALRSALKGDLDWIVMKTIEKDRARRYETVNGLARDIERHLKHEPVSAGSPSTPYRVGKFLRRHKTVAVATVAVFLALVAGLIGTFSQAQRALRTADLARREADRATAINDLFLGTLRAASPYTGPDTLAGRELRVVDVLDRAEASIPNNLADQPALEVAVRAALGAVYFDLGYLEKAEVNRRRVVELAEATYPPRSPEMASALDELGHTMRGKGDYVAADSLHDRALQIREAVLQPGSAEIALSHYHLGISRRLLYDLESAQEHIEQALAMHRHLFGNVHKTVADDLNQLGSVFAESDLEASEAALREAMAIREELYGPDDLAVVGTMNNLAILLQRREKFEEAEPLYLRALDIERRELGADHPNVAQKLNNFGMYLYRTGEIDEAEAYFRDAITTAIRAYGTDRHLEITSYRNNLALSLVGQDRVDEARENYELVIAIRRELMGPDHQQVAVSLVNYGALLTRLGDYEEAERIHREALAIYRSAFAEDHWQVATSENLLGEALIGLQRYAEAEELLTRAYDIILAAFGEEHGRTRAVLRRLTLLYEAWGRPEELEKYRR